MKNIFSNKIATKDLYLVTLKHLLDVEFINKGQEARYIMSKKTEYTICKRKYDIFKDVFTNEKYEFLINTRKGNYGVKKATAMECNEKYTTKEELEERLKLIKEQAEKLRSMNKNNIENNNNYNNIPKTKKLIPFPKKY